MKETTNSQVDCIVVGPNHYNTLNVIRSLGREKFSVFLIIVSDKKKNFVLRSRYAKLGIRISDYCEIVTTLIKIGPQFINKIPLIAINDRSAVQIDKAYDVLKEFYLLPNCSDQQGRIIYEMNKDRQVKIAQKIGFNIPYSKRIDLTCDEWYNIDFEYPCIVKPLKSIDGSKYDMKICYGYDDLQSHFQKIKDNVKFCQVQQYIPNDRFFLIGGVRLQNGQIIIPGIIEKIKTGKRNHTLGLNALGRLSLPETGIIEKCVRYIELIDYHGLFSFECVYSKDFCQNLNDLYFIELNLRTDGLFYFYDGAGISLPSVWVKSVNSITISEEDFIVSRPIIGMSELMYISEFLSLGKIFSFIKDIIRTDIFCYFRSYDLLPFLSKFTRL